MRGSLDLKRSLTKIEKGGIPVGEKQQGKGNHPNVVVPIKEDIDRGEDDRRPGRGNDTERREKGDVEE